MIHRPSTPPETAASHRAPESAEVASDEQSCGTGDGGEYRDELDQPNDQLHHALGEAFREVDQIPLGTTRGTWRRS